MGSHFLPTFSWNIGKCPKSIPRPDSHLLVWVETTILHLMGGRQGGNKLGHKTKDHAFRDNHSRFFNFSNAMPKSWTLGLPTVHQTPGVAKSAIWSLSRCDGVKSSCAPQGACTHNASW